jgi:hypothetical protein
MAEKEEGFVVVKGPNPEELPSIMSLEDFMQLWADARAYAPDRWTAPKDASVKPTKVKTRTAEAIKAEIAKIEADKRLHYPSANVQINAPLALIQLTLETRRDALRWVLGE